MSKRVLIVDDDPAQRRILEEVIKHVSAKSNKQILVDFPAMPIDVGRVHFLTVVIAVTEDSGVPCVPTINQTAVLVVVGRVLGTSILDVVLVEILRRGITGKPPGEDDKGNCVCQSHGFPCLNYEVDSFLSSTAFHVFRGVSNTTLRTRMTVIGGSFRKENSIPIFGRCIKFERCGITVRSGITVKV